MTPAPPEGDDDVARFVAPDGAIDVEAHARGVTVYSPDAKAPLLPPVPTRVPIIRRTIWRCR